MSDTTVRVNDFSEETYWIAQCPKCGNYLESFEEPSEASECHCDHCDSNFDIVG